MSLNYIYDNLVTSKDIYMIIVLSYSMNRLSVVKMLENMQIPVFTVQQFSAILGKDSAYAAVLLNRMIGANELTRIMRGRFALPDTDILCIASSIYFPSYVSLWKAFEYYGATTQMPRMVDVVCTKRPCVLKIELETGNFQIRFINTASSKIYGIKKVKIEGKIAFIAEKERAIIDSLQYMDYISLDEVYFSMSSTIEPEKIIEYAKRSEKQSVMKRAGYLLEKAGYSCQPYDFGGLSQTYVPLDPKNPKQGKYDPKWRIIVNTVIE